MYTPIDNPAISDDDVAVYKFDSDGTFLWERILFSSLPGGTSAVDAGGQPVVDGNGDVFMAFTSEGGAIEPETNQGGRDVFLVKLDGQTGAVIESR